jgi:hypothetical protein
MQGNGTTTNNRIGLSGENIATLVVSGMSLLGSILTFTYFKIKSKFSDEQNTKIELSTTHSGHGNTEAKIIIELKNYEKYGTEFTTTANGKKEKESNGEDVDVFNLDETLNGGNSKNNTTVEIIEKMNEGMETITSNNNKGDEIIHQTRNHVTRDALNAFVKLLQIQSLKSLGESPLDIHSLHSTRRDNSIIIEKTKVGGNKYKVSDMKKDARKKFELERIGSDMVYDDAPEDPNTARKNSQTFLKIPIKHTPKKTNEEKKIDNNKIIKIDEIIKIEEKSDKKLSKDNNTMPNNKMTISITNEITEIEMNSDKKLNEGNNNTALTSVENKDHEITLVGEDTLKNDSITGIIITSDV